MLWFQATKWNEIKLLIVSNVSCEVIYFRGFHWFSIFFSSYFFILTQTTPLCLPFSVILLLLFRYSKKWFSFDLCYSEMKVYKEIKKKSERRRLAEIEKNIYISNYKPLDNGCLLNTIHCNQMKIRIHSESTKSHTQTHNGFQCLLICTWTMM